MLDFLNRFFKKEETTELKESELKHFFNEKAKVITKELNEKLSEIREKIYAEIKRTKENLLILSTAKLKNPNIPVRANQILEGNRESYIKAVNSFIDSLKIPENYDSVLAFAAEFQLNLERFASSTMKAYHVLQEFFGHESREVALNIKGIESHVKSLKVSIEQKKLDKVRELKEAILDLDRSKEEQKNLEKEISEMTSIISDDEKKLENIKTLQSSLKQGNEYQELISLEELKKSAMNESAQLQAKFFHSFSVINAALKKYARINLHHASLIDEYSNDPVKAALNDSQLSIIHVLESLEKEVMNDKVELKDKKKEKTVEEIKKLNRDFFMEFKNHYHEIVKKIGEFDSAIQKNSSRSDLEKLNEQLSGCAEKKKTNEEKLESLNKKISNIDLNKIRERIINYFASEFSMKIKLSENS